MQYCVIFVLERGEGKEEEVSTFTANNNRKKRTRERRRKDKNNQREARSALLPIETVQAVGAEGALLVVLHLSRHGIFYEKSVVFHVWLHDVEEHGANHLNLLTCVRGEV